MAGGGGAGARAVGGRGTGRGENRSGARPRPQEQVGQLQERQVDGREVGAEGGATGGAFGGSLPRPQDQGLFAGEAEAVAAGHEGDGPAGVGVGMEADGTLEDGLDLAKESCGGARKMEGR